MKENYINLIKQLLYIAKKNRDITKLYTLAYNILDYI